MTTLVVDKLETTLEQDLAYSGSERIAIASIAPYLLMYNNPSGTFTLSVLKGSELLFSKSFTSAEIKTAMSTTDNYAHVFYPIIPDNGIQLEGGTYKFRISASGYTASESSYMGWIRQFENIQTELDYVPYSDLQKPYSIRIKQYKRYS
jgi:hypothetical protein